MWEERVRINGILEVPNNFPVESFQPWERERQRQREIKDDIQSSNSHFSTMGL